MHTTQLGSREWANHNGSFDGDVVLRLDGDRVKLLQNAAEVTIPMEYLTTLVAAMVRLQKIAAIEQASDEEVLGIAPQQSLASASNSIGDL